MTQRSRDHVQVVTRSDDDLIALLCQRHGIATRVELDDGRRLRVVNIAWGYDDGEQWAHVTTNVSPSLDGESIDVFSTQQMVRITDPANETVLYSAGRR